MPSFSKVFFSGFPMAVGSQKASRVSQGETRVYMYVCVLLLLSEKASCSLLAVQPPRPSPALRPARFEQSGGGETSSL